MLEILKQLFINLAIIIATLTLGNMIIRDKLGGRRRRDWVWISVLSGVFGCLLMLFSVKVSENIILDFRCIPIILMGIYFSFPAAMIASVIISAFRLAVYGFNLTTASAMIAVILVGLACGLIGRTRWKIEKKWLICGVTAAVIPDLHFAFILYGSDAILSVLLSYLLGTAVAVTLMFFFMKYITGTNAQYYFIRDAANRDYLTGLSNVRHFDASLNAYLVETKKTKTPLSLLFIDIDFFKKVNDVYGHLIGDMVLKEIGQILAGMSRDTDTVTRIGGEEFTVLLPNCCAAEALGVAERIRETIAGHRFAQNETIQVSVSIGIASFPETTVNEDKLTEQADIALYRAKRSGRNMVCLAEREMQNSI